jgi:hypothetical protein
MTKNTRSTPSTVIKPWHAPLKPPFKIITKDACEVVGFLGKAWRVTMDEMVITEIDFAGRVEEGLYTLIASDGEVRRVTSSAYLDFIKRLE